MVIIFLFHGKEYIAVILTLVVLMAATALAVQAACPSHGSSSLSYSCAKYPSSVEVRPCYVGSHPSDCETQRYSNYSLEKCTARLPDPDRPCPHQTYGSLHLCIVKHPAAGINDPSYCLYY